MSLESVGQLVAEHTSTPLDERKASKAEFERKILRNMVAWMTWGLLVLGIGILMVVADKAFAIGNLFRFISTVLILVGVGLVTAGVFRALKDGSYLAGMKVVDQVSASKNTKELPTGETPASLPSVTERTTQLLPVDDVPASDRRTNKVIGSNGRE